MEEFKARRCPNCKGTRFSVLVDAFQNWDSEDDEWGDVEVLDVLDKKDAYMCLNCENTFISKNDLEVFKPKD